MPGATAVVCGGVGCAAALGMMRHRSITRTAEQKSVKDCEAAFPTAQMVAALRAMDAKSSSPLIGSNIGAGPDVFAEALAGELGFTFAKDLGGNHDTMVRRTMYYDEKIMNMVDAGCKQLVILAAGLDARAWRLPRLDKSVKVFEVDIPRAIAYKAQKLAALQLDTSCSRIAVEADLSDAGWTSKLIAAGFQPDQTSFFLIEGLLMYLPPGAPQALHQSASSLMNSGSMIAGDTFVDCLRFMPPNPVLEKYGTKWTFDVASKEELVRMLSDVSLKDAEVHSATDWGQQPPQNGIGKAQADAQKLAKVLDTLPSWPAAAIDWVRGQVAQKNGAEKVVREIVEDRMGFHGLKESSAEHKCRVCELLLQDGCAAKLESMVHELPAGQERSTFRKVYDFVAMMYAMMQAKKRGGGGSGYVLYAASKL